VIQYSLFGYGIGVSLGYRIHMHIIDELLK
jgi:hypothetical protein